jgi:hypothetical protein
MTGIAFGWIGFNDRVRRRGEEAVDQVRAGDRLRLGATITFEFGPDASEREWRAIIIEREPHNVLSRLTDCALSDALCSSVLRLGRPKGQNNR